MQAPRWLVGPWVEHWLILILVLVLFGDGSIFMHSFVGFFGDAFVLVALFSSVLLVKDWCCLVFSVHSQDLTIMSPMRRKTSRVARLGIGYIPITRSSSKFPTT